MAVEVAVVTADTALMDWIMDVAATVGATVTVAVALPAATADLTVIGADQVPSMLRRGCDRPQDTVLAGPDGDETLWSSAADLGLLGVVTLPSGSAWLAQRIRRCTGELNETGHIIGVVSAVGGAGASTMAALLSVTAVARGQSAVVIDADPQPAGVECLLGSDPQPSWSRFAGVRGYLDSDELADLPVSEGVAYLGWAGQEPIRNWADSLGSIVEAAASAFDVVVVDLGRSIDLATRLPSRTQPLVLVPARLRAVATAAVVVEQLAAYFDHRSTVVLRDVGGRHAPSDWVRALPPSYATRVLELDQHAVDDEDAGRPPGTRRRSSAARLAADLLAGLPAPTAG